jgi:hypothetical protein
MKIHKSHMIIEVEDLGGGECSVSPHGAFTPAAAVVLLITAMELCLRSSDLTFDQVVQWLKLHIEENGFADWKIARGDN